MAGSSVPPVETSTEDSLSREIKDLRDEVKRLKGELSETRKKERQALRDLASAQSAGHTGDNFVVLGGVRYDIKYGPIRADLMLDHVKKGYVHEDQSALTIDRYE